MRSYKQNNNTPPPYHVYYNIRRAIATALFVYVKLYNTTCCTVMLKSISNFIVHYNFSQLVYITCQVLPYKTAQIRYKSQYTWIKMQSDVNFDIQIHFVQLILLLCTRKCFRGGQECSHLICMYIRQ